MSRSFKKNMISSDFLIFSDFLGDRNLVKKIWKKKIRTGKEISRADSKIIAMKEITKISDYIGKPYHAMMK